MVGESLGSGFYAPIKLEERIISSALSMGSLDILDNPNFIQVFSHNIYNYPKEVYAITDDTGIVGIAYASVNTTTKNVQLAAYALSEKKLETIEQQIKQAEVSEERVVQKDLYAANVFESSYLHSNQLGILQDFETLLKDNGWEVAFPRTVTSPDKVYAIIKDSQILGIGYLVVKCAGKDYLPKDLPKEGRGTIRLAVSAFSADSARAILCEAKNIVEEHMNTKYKLTNKVTELSVLCNENPIK